ncbi:MAG: enoyl-CoA hydratase/isomerase family protein [Nocardioides sp.]|uniref:enoyl-CoA hydratase/isomerase family protein n=1 Tax=Nocardioides sp. TaxID=35761 RepID=UPI0039E36761
MSGRAEVRLESLGSGIRRLVLANPPHNALSTAMCEQAVAHLRTLLVEDELRALIVTGAGRAFCAGADLAELRAGLDPTTPLSELVELIRHVPVPVIAAIEGPAAGGGVEIALACDLRVAAVSATFTASAVNVGLFAGWYHLPRLIGQAAASEMILTGQRYAAEELARWGLVRLADPDEVHEVAARIAARIASRPPLSVRALTHALRASPDMDPAAAERHQRETFARLRASRDHAEAVAAFLDKRTPMFTGR